MTAVKSFALGALVIGTVAHSTLAAPVRSANIRWLGWNNLGEVAAAVPVAAPMPTPAPAPMPVQPSVATNWQASASWSTDGGNQPFQAPAPAPTPAPATASISFSPSAFGSSAVSPQPAPAAASGQPMFDAFVNLTDGKYAEAGNLTTGNPSAWYNSPVAAQVFGGVPNAQQRSDFTAAVLSNVQHTFSLAGVPINLTSDPNAPAAHTLSVVSGASYLQNPDTIGITDVGQNGFDFIDKMNSAKTPQDLELAVAHNVSHELMHAFGIAVHHDTTGNYVDAGSASWSLLTNPNATFSPDTVQDLLSRSFTAGPASGLLGGQSGQEIDGEQTIAAQTVPEPSTVILWTLIGGIGLVRARRRMSA